MNAAQMLKHCSLVLEIPLGKLQLPKPFIGFKLIGIITKYEMKIFNNGIPPNMPTFPILKVHKNCIFENEKSQLVQSLEKYQQIYLSKQLPPRHELFGKMTEQDWGFLEYKHLHHHLKQFGV